ncbi:MAG: ornithine cyclodeaminase family protein [Candidatus Saccharicenans sp.]|uniref:ornithine cyclodeaminase family protein n=1 Tax=Candidatus Saccharicenans sp. TaxID=2819258 RepID=UPI00404B0AAB
MDIRIYREPEIKELVNLSASIEAVESSFAAYSSGQAVLPGVINLDLPQFQGEVHVKAAYIKGEEYYVIKVASGFYQNPELGLPVGNGLMLVFKAETGELAAILLDNGYLTELRTAAAGAVAAKYLAKKQIDQVAVIGSGVQARFQLKALAEVRSFEEVRVWSRNQENVRKYIVEMEKTFPAVEFKAVFSAEEAVRGADLIITATASRQPVVRAEWLKPGVHITAMGSDGPEKRELYPEVLAMADMVYCDSVAQGQRLGEVHHGLESGAITLDKVSGEIGEVILGRKPGRLSEDEITVADLTGLGVQDAAVAGLFLRLARNAVFAGHTFNK